MIDFTYLKQPSKRWTFEQPKLKLWVEKWCKGRVLNLFAGKTRLNVDEIRVDISSEYYPDYIMDANEFLLYWSQDDMPKFDTVILDPPYNWRKAKEKYGNNMIGSYPILKNSLIEIINPHARIISLGYDTVGMSKKRGFVKIAICLICHGGDHHDTIGLVEEYQQMRLL